MRQNTVRRARLLQFGAPAAVLGTLAGSLAASPATADVAHSTQPHLTLARASGAAPAHHVVQAGDTVYAIANRYGIRTADVLSWNGLDARAVIYPGQVLRLSAPATPVASPAPVVSARTHVVVAGDTVYAIAHKHGVSVDAVLAANGLSRQAVIYPGQSLTISASAPDAAATPTPAAAPAAAAPTSGQTHLVAAGDTLFAIAAAYGTSVSALYTLNGLGPDSIIYPGQRVAVSAAPAAASVSGQRSAALDAEQAANAATIIAIGRQLGVPDRGIAIALATAMVESGMRNLDHGDRDSLGLFQQRPSTGWGTPDQALDVDRSTRAFYGGASDPNGLVTRGLLDIDGWQDMAFTDAAQAVQISAYPSRYGEWETQAYQWLALHG